ncbi:MAG: SCO family protein [Gemmatimonadales bacterium]
MNRGWFAVLVATVIGCARADATLSPHGFVGTELAVPVAKPGLPFIDSHGRPFRLDSATAGRVTLVFFGYTHCPDVCPIHLANLAAVLDKMPEEVQRNVTVVFITTDPERDSLPVLDAWVHGFSPDFIGLTGSDSIVAAAQRDLRLPPIEKSVPGPDGGYTVGHSSAVIAFTRDGLGRVEYPFGTRQRDWAHDLPLLVSFGS